MSDSSSAKFRANLHLWKLCGKVKKIFLKCLQINHFFKRKSMENCKELVEKRIQFYERFRDFEKLYLIYSKVIYVVILRLIVCVWLWIMCYEMKNKREAWVKIRKCSSKYNKPVKATYQCHVVWSSFWESCNRSRCVLFSLNLKKVAVDSFLDAVSR